MSKSLLLLDNFWPRFRLLVIALPVFCGLVACDSDNSIAPAALEFVGAPSLASAAPAPLTRSLSVTSSVVTKVRLELTDGAAHSYSIQFDDFATDHTLSVRGMQPGNTYTVEVWIEDQFGKEEKAATDLTLTTDPLPDDFPMINLVFSDPAAMEPGYTLLDATRHNRSASYLVMVDDTGRTIWYLPGDNRQSDTKLLPAEGLLLSLNFDTQTINKMDFDGNVMESWHASQSADVAGSTPVDMMDLHHDVVAMPDGTFLTSSRESLRQVDNFPIDETDVTQTGTVTVRDEPVVQFDASGTIVNKWDFLDMLKPTRIAFNGTLGLPGLAADWIHLNAIWYDETDDAILVSLRHQDAIVKFSRATGDLIWILGPPANWEGFEQYLLTPVGDFNWQYHQHAVMVTPTGTVLLFDNANNQASPFTTEVPVLADVNASRAVEYDIDETAMTVTQVWEFGPAELGETLYSPFLGDADWLPETSNVLITYGGMCLINNIPSDNLAGCNTQARIVEADRLGTAGRVFDLSVQDTDPTTTGYRVYRSERIPSLYPDGSATITVN